MVALKSLVEGIYAGYSFRSKVVHSDHGDLPVIQMKDIDYKHYTINSRLTLIDSNDMRDKFYLIKNDILFLSKGSNNCALKYELDLPRAIASSAFFVIRPDSSKVVPAYLAWYINQLPVQQYLKENTVGTYTLNINKSVVENIAVSVPTMPIQEKIAIIDGLRRREKLLKELISHKREIVIDTLLLDLTHKEIS